MTKIKLLLCALLMAFAVQVSAQSLVAYHVVGKVTYTANGTTKPLVMNTTVSNSTSINIPYGGKLELLNEKSKQRITLSTPGKGTIAQMSSAKGNSVTELSERYVAYVKKQLTNKGLTSQQRYSDFATVTRERDSVQAKKPAQNSLAARFGNFKKQQEKKFRTFREECNAKYLEFVRQAWEKMGAEPPVVKPNEPEVKPVVIEDTAKTARFLFFGRKKQDSSVDNIPSLGNGKQPQPVDNINEVDVPANEKEYAMMPFIFCGSEMSVRLDETKRLELGKINPNRVADALKHLSSEQYDNLLYDCLALRQKHHLCDWAYLMMLKDISDQFCGIDTNEAVLLLGYLFYQSGYKVRFATDDERLYLLVACDYMIYGKPSYMVDGERFYPVEEVPTEISICKAKFPKENSLSLRIREQMVFDKTEEENRTIKAKDYENFTIDVAVNNSLLEFYNTYPSSFINNDQMTRWQLYAETPLSDEVKEQIYPQLRNQLEGMNELDAANHLLNLVQTGLEYEYDENIWGYDRAFFAEESLHYPFCDCEDRSILFTRLVRDLLDLDCVLVYYPGHLASAVHFTEEVPGDYYTLGNIDYTVCDATYIHAGVGMQMTSMAGKPATLIPLTKAKSNE